MICGYFTGCLLLRDFELHWKTDPLSGVRSFFCRTFDLNSVWFANVNRLIEWCAANLHEFWCWETLDCIGRPTHWVVCDHSFAERVISIVHDFKSRSTHWVECDLSFAESWGCTIGNMIDWCLDTWLNNCLYIHFLLYDIQKAVSFLGSTK